MAGIDDYPDEYSSNYWDDTQASNPYEELGESDIVVAQNHPVAHSISPHTEVELKNYINTSVGIVSLIAENLLCHPFVVLRRQCQVHNNSIKYHLVPITLIPIICNLHKNQGISTLWKGIGSTLLVRGISLGIEDLLSKITPWPKELSRHSWAKAFFQHTLLKSVTLAVTMPFYSASLVETVQSDIASEKPGILDVFREGAIRLLNWTGNVKGRMLPIWVLVVPTVTLGIARYFFSLLVKSGAFQRMQLCYKQKYPARGALPKKVTNISVLRDIELNSSLIAAIASDVVFYPFETIMHRLYMQGTRTIIDDLDTGRAVLPILTNYHGPIDCYESCLINEGTLGLYKGFGALIMQYTVHVLVIRLTRFLLTEITAMMYNTNKPPSIHTSPGVIQHGPVPRKTYVLP